MPLETFTVKTYHTVLQCDACNHVEEHVFEDKDDVIISAEPNYRAKRKQQFDGWHYSYYKIEPVWDAHSKFTEPDKSDMAQKLLCPQCSKENL